jgi:hypothetical protein
VSPSFVERALIGYREAFACEIANIANGLLLTATEPLRHGLPATLFLDPSPQASESLASRSNGSNALLKIRPLPSP